MMISLSGGLLVLRLALGLTIAAHGAQKLFGWFGGSGLAKLTRGFAAQGLRPAWLWVSLVVLGELGGGASVALGLLTPLGAAGVVGAMVMAISKSHWAKGFWNRAGGLEFPMALLAIGVALGLMGPGSYSLDALLGITLAGTPLFLVLAGAALIVDAIGLLTSRERPPARVEAQPRAS